MFQVIQPPTPIPDNLQFSIFLAGSIEMDKAENWQQKIIEAIEDFDVTILNPRRNVWDSSWEQTIDNPHFREQVEWELDGLKKADAVIVYFDPSTKSPISLLELGLSIDKDDMLVCCPQGFWRKGNVDIVCKRFGIKQANSLEEVISILKNGLSKLK